MKTQILLAAALVLNCMLLHSQNITCAERESIIRELVKTGRVSDAWTAWDERGKCAFTGEAYDDIEKALLYKISATKDDEKKKHISNLIGFYSEDDKLYPGNKHNNIVRKAMLLKNEKAGTDDDIYALLDRAYKSDRAAFTDAKAVYTYFALYFDRFKSEKHKLTEDELFTYYDDLVSHVRTITAGENMQQRNYKSALSGMKQLMGTIATCPKVAAYYSKKFNANKSDAAWLERAVTTMEQAKCTADSTYKKIAYQWYAVKPSAQSAYHAAVAALRSNDRKRAVELYEASANFESEPAQKARAYYTIASTMIATDKAMSLRYAKKSIEVKPDFGKGYLLMAQLYSGASDCAKTDFEKKALFLLAAKTAAKAAEVDKGSHLVARNQVEQYMKSAPGSDEIKSAKMAGKEVKFGCWINESLIIPKA